LDALKKVVVTLDKVIEPAIRWTSMIAAAIMALLMFFIGIGVFFRYVFNLPILGDKELNEFMILIVVALSIGYCAMKKGHIIVDILFSRLSERSQAIFNIFHYFIGSVIFALACWRTALEGMLVQSREMTSAVLYIPVFPFFWVAAFGCALLCVVWLYISLQSLVQVLEYSSQAAGKSVSEANQ
jgi:TRAP-type C4-dicarboxylate transport system permease small subunit